MDLSGIGNERYTNMKKVKAPEMTRWEFSLWRFGLWFCLENKRLYISIYYFGKKIYQKGFILE